MKMYNDMVTLQTMDTIFYEAQRQGRISFYVTSLGEEAINIASAAALSLDDLIVPQVTSYLPLIILLSNIKHIQILTWKEYYLLALISYLISHM